MVPIGAVFRGSQCLCRPQLRGTAAGREVDSTGSVVATATANVQQLAIDQAWSMTRVPPRACTNSPLPVAKNKGRPRPPSITCHALSRHRFFVHLIIPEFGNHFTHRWLWQSGKIANRTLDRPFQDIFPLIVVHNGLNQICRHGLRQFAGLSSKAWWHGGRLHDDCRPRCNRLVTVAFVAGNSRFEIILCRSKRPKFT